MSVELALDCIKTYARVTLCLIPKSSVLFDCLKLVYCESQGEISKRSFGQNKREPTFCPNQRFQSFFRELPSNPHIVDSDSAISRLLLDKTLLTRNPCKTPCSLDILLEGPLPVAQPGLLYHGNTTSRNGIVQTPGGWGVTLRDGAETGGGDACRAFKKIP